MKKLFSLFVTVVIVMCAVGFAPLLYASDLTGSSVVSHSSEDADNTLYMSGTCTVNGEEVDCEEMMKDVGNVFSIGFKIIGILLLIGLISFIFWIMMLIHALGNPIPDKALWVIVLIMLPFFGFIIYYFVVKRKYISVPADSISKNINNPLDIK